MFFYDIRHTKYDILVSMIGKLKGNLAEIEGNIGLVETVSGVFYNVYLPPLLLTPKLIGQPLEIYTYHHIREDIQILFGFQTRKDYQIFTLLLTVSGVGPKTAYSVISYSSVDELIQAITHNEVAFFKGIPGLGTKTAMKIILELSQKFKSDFKMEKMYLSDDDKTVVDALISLGFKSQEAKDILQKVPKDFTVEKRITEAIRLATSRGD